MKSLTIKFSAETKFAQKKETEEKLIEKEEKKIIDTIQAWLDNEEITKDHVDVCFYKAHKEFFDRISHDLIEEDYVCYLHQGCNKHPANTYMVALPSRKVGFMGEPCVCAYKNQKLLDAEKAKAEKRAEDDAKICAETEEVKVEIEEKTKTETEEVKVEIVDVKAETEEN